MTPIQQARYLLRSSQHYLAAARKHGTPTEISMMEAAVGAALDYLWDAQLIAGEVISGLIAFHPHSCYHCDLPIERGEMHRALFFNHSPLYCFHNSCPGYQEDYQ